MYYVWKQEKRLTSKYAYFMTEPKGFDLGDWITGNPFRTPPPKFTISPAEERPSALSDLLLTRFDLQIVSQKLRLLFKDLNLNNVEYYPINIKHLDSGEIVEEYSVAHFLGNVDCLDKSRSQCEYFESGNLQDVTEFEIDVEKVARETAPRIFRLGEFPYIILVHEQIKNEIHNREITGVKFLSTKDYIG